MRQRSFLTAFPALLLMSCLAVYGCGEDSITGAEIDDGVLELTEDPLDGVMNSTLGATPVDPSDRISRLAETLGLDDDQITAFTEAYLTFRKEIEELKAQVAAGDLSREDARAEAASLREALETELQLILTSEQWDLFQELRQNRDGRKHGSGSPGDRWATWLAEIGADDEQTAAVMDALTVLHDGIQSRRDQVQAGEVTKEDARETVQTLRDAFKASLAEILTAEQLAALQELRPDHRGKHRR